MKKVLSLALVLMMIFVSAGCGSGRREIVKLTLSTEDSEAILAAAGITLPDAEETLASGTTVKYFCWYDNFHNYNESEIINTGYWTFTEKYGCEVEWIECEWNTRYDEVANLILGGTPPDFFPSSSDIFPLYCIKGVFQPVNDYIDYNDPLWSGMKEYVDTYFTLGDKQWVMACDNSFYSVCLYNRRVLDEWGFDDPAELYANDEWTWDAFFDMCVEFSDPDEDRYALDGWAYHTALTFSSGYNLVEYNPETGYFESNIDKPELERAADLLYNLTKNDCIYPIWQKGTRGDVEGTGLKEGQLLFFIRGTSWFTDTVETVSSIYGDIAAGELMFVPLPRDTMGDGKYYIEATTSGYALINGAQNPEGVALLASCERFKAIDPTVMSIDRRQLEDTYMWTDEMLKMYDHCVELANSMGADTIVDYSYGMGDSLYSAVNSLKSQTRSSTPQTWAQGKEKYSDTIDYYLEELNANIDTYIGSH